MDNVVYHKDIIVQSKDPVAFRVEYESSFANTCHYKFGWKNGDI